MKNLISIIIPVYNVEEYIEKCIKSVINKSIPKYEVLIIDDGSTDNSIKKIEALLNSQKLDDKKNIRIIHQNNSGLGAARNTGLSHAIGEYVFFLDSDDWIEEKALEYMLNIAQKKEADIVVGKMSYRFDNKKNDYIEPLYLDENISLDNLESLKELFKMKKFKFHACGKLYKRTLFENIRFPDKEYYEDIATMYKIFLKSKKTVYANINSYEYYMREGSICNSGFSDKHLAFVDHLDNMQIYLQHSGMHEELEKNYKKLKLMLYIQLGFRKIGKSNIDINKKKNYIKSLRIKISDLLNDRKIKLASKDKIDRCVLRMGDNVYLITIMVYKYLIQRRN